MSVNLPETLDGFTTNVGKLPKPKFQNVNMAKVVVSPLNPRFNGSNNSLGLNTQSAQELADQLKRDLRILNRLVINRNTKTGQDEAVRGGRRTMAAHLCLADPTSPQELIENLGKTEAEIYEDLTDEQVLWLANDQDQKKFHWTEVLNLMFTLFKMGYTWKQVAVRVYRQYGALRGAAGILNEIDTITDAKQRELRIAKWLRGYVDEVAGEAHRIGDMCVKQLLLEAAEKDKLIRTVNNTSESDRKVEGFKVVDGPEVYLTQARLDALRKAKELDVKAHNWNGMVGGPEFQKVWDEMKWADKGFKPDGVTPLEAKDTTKSLTRNTLKELNKNAVKSKLAMKMIDLAAGDKEVEWKESDTEVATFEVKQGVLVQFGEQLREKNAEAYKMFKLCLLGTDPAEFLKTVQEMVK